jgi:hypothetical protein
VPENTTPAGDMLRSEMYGSCTAMADAAAPQMFRLVE